MNTDLHDWASGSGSFTLPENDQGWSFSGTTSEDNGQSGTSEQSADFTLASGNWQQSDGTGTNSGHAWQTSDQSGSYTHNTGGVTLRGTFSQDASLDDTTDQTTSGSPDSSGNWVPSGTGSETLVTSSSNSYDGSGSAQGTPSLGLPELYNLYGVALYDSLSSSGSQTESESASANHTTLYSLGSDGVWQGTSGSGTTSGDQTVTTGYSGSGTYTTYDGDYGEEYDGWWGGGSVQGSFAQGQNDTVSFNFNTDDSYIPPSTSESGSGLPGYWQATGGRGSAADSGGSNLSYSASGNYAVYSRNGLGNVPGPSGSMSQNGQAEETFNYSKSYTVASGGAWQISKGDGYVVDIRDPSNRTEISLLPIMGMLPIADKGVLIL